MIKGKLKARYAHLVEPRGPTPPPSRSTSRTFAALSSLRCSALAVMSLRTVIRQLHSPLRGVLHSRTLISGRTYGAVAQARSVLESELDTIRAAMFSSVGFVPTEAKLNVGFKSVFEQMSESASVGRTSSSAATASASAPPCVATSSTTVKTMAQMRLAASWVSCC